jgi:hypothetical protein
MRGDRIGLIGETMTKLGWAPTGPGSWATSLTNGAAFPVWASLDAGWLRFEAEFAELPDASPSELLVAGGSLPPLVRVALSFFSPNVTSVRLVADLDDESSDPWPSRIEEVSEALTAAASRLNDASIDESEPEAPLPDSIAEAVRNAGWTCEARGESELEIPLDDADGFGARARLAARGGGLRLFAPLRTIVAGGDDACADATAIFLLLISHRLRTVRAVARGDATRRETTVGWETALPSEPRSEDLERALGALTVACRHSIREIAALTTPAIAQHYLDQRGALTRAPFTKARASL